MKKVLFFIESLAGGGAEKVFADMISNLNYNKYSVDVVTLTDDGVYDDVIKKYANYKSVLKCCDYRQGGIKRVLYWIKLKAIYLLPIKIVARFLFKEQYDVEISFVEGFGTKLIAASSNSMSRKITWIHTDMEKNPYANAVYNNFQEHVCAYSKYDRICCVSNSVKEVFGKMFFDSDKVIVQYNPVDSVQILLKGSEKIDILPNQSIQLGTIGRLEYQKGYPRLLEALGKLYNMGYDFSLWIIGKGSQQNELEEIIQKYGMEDKVKLLGFHTNPYKYISKCDAFICSSYAEGFSTAATESLILGVPIFTTECAGMQELFGNEQCGEIVGNSDQELYDMLLKLVSGEWKPADYKESVKSRAVDFDIKKRILEIEQLLDE